MSCPAAVGAAGVAESINRQMQAAGTQTGLTKRNPQELAGRVIKSILTILGILAVALIVYAGFLWMTARGEETQLTEAKTILRAAIIGLAIILSAYAITITVLGMLVGATTGTSDQNSYYNAQPQPYR